MKNLQEDIQGVSVWRGREEEDEVHGELLIDEGHLVLVFN